MGHLVADLLTLARLEGSPRPTADRWVARRRAAARRSRPRRGRLSAGRHAIDFGAAGDAQIAGSESELHSAVGNLVNNAVRYTPDGGRIEVAWSSPTNGRARSRSSTPAAASRATHLSRLTERFYRVDSSRSRESGGTGPRPGDRQARRCSATAASSTSPASPARARPSVSSFPPMRVRVPDLSRRRRGRAGRDRPAAAQLDGALTSPSSGQPARRGGRCR